MGCEVAGYEGAIGVLRRHRHENVVGLVFMATTPGVTLALRESGSESLRQSWM